MEPWFRPMGIEKRVGFEQGGGSEGGVPPSWGDRSEAEARYIGEHMPNFMIAYYGGNKPASQEEGMAQMEKWNAWVKGLGETIVNPGTPLPVSKIVTSSRVEDDHDPNSMKGFAVVKAESIVAAVEIAQSDPFLENGGTIRVSQMMEMNEQGSC